MAICVVFDCESDGLPSEGERNGECCFKNVECTCACACVFRVDDPYNIDVDAAVASAESVRCLRTDAPSSNANPFDGLLAAFDRADVIVSYNGLAFDMPLMRKYYPKSESTTRYMSHRHKALDVMHRLHGNTGIRCKLDTLLSQNGLPRKTDCGSNAVRLWENEEYTKLLDYCQRDVEITARLALQPQLLVGPYVVPETVYGVLPALRAFAPHAFHGDAVME